MRFFGYKFRRVLVILVFVWKWKYFENSHWNECELWECLILIFQIFTECSEAFGFSHWKHFYDTFQPAFCAVLQTLQTYYESCDIFMRNHFTNSGNRMEFFALNLFFSNHFKWVLMQTRMLMWRSISIWASMYITQYNKRLDHFN